jgi:hypothetical protein
MTDNVFYQPAFQSLNESKQFSLAQCEAIAEAIAASVMAAYKLQSYNNQQYGVPPHTHATEEESGHAHTISE